jgi:hypothetical protein
VILGGAQKTRMLVGMWTVKAVLMRFQRTLLRITLEVICVCPDTLWEVYFKSDRLFFHSKLQNSPAMAWLFLAASSQVYSAKTRVERLEKLAVWFKKPV